MSLIDNAAVEFSLLDEDALRVAVRKFIKEHEKRLRLAGYDDTAATCAAVAMAAHAVVLSSDNESVAATIAVCEMQQTGFTLN